jgi:hypothetical protein
LTTKWLTPTIPEFLLTGQDNLVDLNGTYKIADGNLDMNLDISRLNLKASRVSHWIKKESTGFF